MRDLGLALDQVREWFPHERDNPCVLVRVSVEHANRLSADLGLAVRRCYLDDSTLSVRSQSLEVPPEDIIAAKLPDPGSTMAGDFGEILVYLYLGTRELPNVPVGATKWRLKQARTQPVPYSDVVQFVLPAWPVPSPDDVVLCAEVKTKSTAGPSTPITNAIADARKDRTSRLTKTLIWLRERALGENLGDVRVEHLDRFIKAVDHPDAQKRFYAVAVVSDELVEAELPTAPTEAPAECAVIVMSVPRLQETYTAVFTAARHATLPANPGATAN